MGGHSGEKRNGISCRGPSPAEPKSLVSLGVRASSESGPAQRARRKRTAAVVLTQSSENENSGHLEREETVEAEEREMKG